MKPTDVQTSESLERVEQLLRAAAAWEPEQPAPEGLASRALTAEAARRQEQRERRPRVRRVAFWGLAFGGLAGAGACASLALGLMQRLRGVAVAPTSPPASAPVRRHPAPQSNPYKPVFVSVPPNQPPPGLRAAAAVTPRIAHLRRAARTAAPPRVRWQEAPPSNEPVPVLAPGWLVEDQPDGTLVATPGVIAIPVNACAPPDGAEQPGESPAGNAPSDQINQSLENTNHDKDPH